MKTNSCLVKVLAIWVVLFMKGFLSDALFAADNDPEEVVLFNESFDSNSGMGGNDGNWNGSAVTGSTGEVVVDNEGWSFENAYSASKCIRIGDTYNSGLAKTPCLGFSGAALLTFKAAAFESSNENTEIVIITPQGVVERTIQKGIWKDISLVIDNVTNATQIVFKSKKDSYSYGRLFLDEVKIVQYKKTLATDNNQDYWSTFSSESVTFIDESAVVKTAYVNNDGQLVLQNVEKNEELHGTIIPANTGVLLYSDSEVVRYCKSESTPSSIEVSTNFLHPGTGSLITMGDGYEYFKLAYHPENGKIGFFYGAENGAAYVAKKGGAFLAVDKSLLASTQARGFCLEDSEANIDAIEQEIEPENFYSLDGRYMGNNREDLPQGIYVNKGEKVLIK